ncbi:hypothetical protein SUGI_0193750 [Cryptomeria japonica]|uniref:late embryogenesis abundant protein D-34 n=1 Tax=Cryptomeria japonica TaxID=3369 RepID=UPI002408F02C|nr:late embryogenesis abundant protein D-34 [Cryptomeria japonica]GLJ12576.1 hypothetical protein SUGI_0193750 [Cryptomeria japonica]
MSEAEETGQAQARRGHNTESEAITYGEVFKVRGDLARQAISPGDAALMHSAETRALGQMQKVGVAARMQEAAHVNEMAGVVDKGDDTSLAAVQGMAVTETVVPGRKVRVEYVSGQPVSCDIQTAPAPHATAAAANVTIGEALEAAALRSGDKPVEQSDAAAIQSADRRATGIPVEVPGGIASAAQSAADMNPGLPYEERTTLADVLSTATLDLPADKAVMMEDAHRIKEREARRRVSGQVFPGGVGDTMEAAALINEPGDLTVDH